MKSYLPVLSIIILLAAGCKDNKPQSEQIDVDPLHIVRVDELLADSEPGVIPDSILPAVEFIDYMMNRAVTGDSSAVEAYRSSRAFQVFAPDVKRLFTQQDSIEQVLGVIDHKLRETFTGSKGLGTIYGLIIPYNTPVVTTDSTVMIGLNHYLGTDYPGYSGFDSYRLRSKTARHLPYDVTEGRIVADYPMQASGDGTLLNGMLYWGAVTKLVSETVPDAEPEEIFNLTPEEFKWMEDNRENIWKALVEKQLLYSTNPDVAERLLYPAPKSFLINNDAPGMAARYIGYLIVSSYLKNHPEMTAAQMLSPDMYNSESTLINSGFTGK